MKDVPTEIPDGLEFAAITRREDPRDCLISREARHAENACRRARASGTSSLRRQAQLRHHRPDIEAVDLRGNVDTRLKKLDAGEFDAIVLAVAGVNRLGVATAITQLMTPMSCCPRSDKALWESRLARTIPRLRVWSLHSIDADSRACVTAERALLA